MAEDRSRKPAYWLGPSKGTYAFVGGLFVLGLLLFIMALILPNLRVFVHIASTPEGASIYIDCKEIEAKTPATVEISSGHHQIGVKKPGVKLALESVDVDWLDWGVLRDSIDVTLAQDDWERENADLIFESVSAERFPAIKVMMKVKDHSGRYLRELSAANFQVQETKEELCLNGTPEIRNFNEIGRGRTIVDIVFVVDNTNSMAGEINTLKQNLIEFAEKLVANNINFRLAGIAFGDEVPYRDLKEFTPEFTAEKEAAAAAREFKKWVAELKAVGGGDNPENSLDALIHAAEMEFRPESQKYLVLVTDATAHTAGDRGNSMTEATFEKARASLRAVDQCYYSSPQAEYGDSLSATNLGWPFSKEILTEKLLNEIVSKYVFYIEDAFGTEVKGERSFKLTVNAPNGEVYEGRSVVVR